MKHYAKFAAPRAHHNLHTVPLEEADNICATEAEEDLAAEIDAAFTKLTPRQCLIVKLRYGLGGYDKYTLEEVGKQFGLTRERIRQIEMKALIKLQGVMTNARYAADRRR
jgi:RNA polymerase sigma factor (sigma-70 family)